MWNDNPGGGGYPPVGMPPGGPSPYGRRRPPLIWVLFPAMVLLGVLGLLLSAVIWSDLTNEEDHGRDVSGGLYVIVLVGFAVAIAQIVAGIWLIWGSLVARGLAVSACAINALGGLVQLAQGNSAAILGVALNIGLIVMLNRPAVKEFCSPS